MGNEYSSILEEETERANEFPVRCLSTLLQYICSTIPILPFSNKVQPPIRMATA